MHIGFIMDGNRRWAKENGVPKLKQHEAGFENMKNILLLCLEKNIPCISFWGLAYRNIVERSELELNTIYSLVTDRFIEFTVLGQKHGIKFTTVGDISLLPKKTQLAIQDLKDLTKDGTAMTCVIALAYGGQREIIQGVQRCIEAGEKPENITEESFRKYLDTGTYPDPDLIVRTGCSGRNRHSGYFLYTSEYSEYHFTETCWPAFDENELNKALESLNNAERNFGK